MDHARSAEYIFRTSVLHDVLSFNKINIAAVLAVAHFRDRPKGSIPEVFC
jgi:hypothetical protein